MSDNRLQTQGALFQAVQLAHLFDDSKTFPDSVPLMAPDRIEEEFRSLLGDFVRSRFALPQAGDSTPAARPGGPIDDEVAGRDLADVDMAAHIDALWRLLTRDADRPAAGGGSLVPLPYPYVVPGGRFREIYYWDSYFTMLGLVASGRTELVGSMVRNFAWLIGEYGHVPNGNRSYFLSRSQPPVFGLMLALLERERGFEAVRPHLAALEREYAFWMDCESVTGSGVPFADRRTVRLAGGVVLNRYWDPRNMPREESWAEDVELFERADPARQDTLYRDLRAAAESGWDFSSRWCGPDHGLQSIRTTGLIPVDLNCLLYRVETLLADWLARAGDVRAEGYARAAEQRRKAILALCWDDEAGWFFDYDWREGARTGCWSLAALFALFCGVANQAQADRVAERVAERFLKPGGVVTTLTQSREQWDSPNGWAPLQWVTVQGLLAHGHETLARDIATRFVALARRVWQRTGKLMEKYDVCDMSLDAGGGEYPVQDGFGWTNGVVRAFIARFGSG